MAASALAAYVANLPRNRLHDAVSLLQATHAMQKNLVLDDRTLSTLVRAAAADDEVELALTIARRMIAQFPRSPYLPGTLWEVAMVQERAGRTEAAIKGLRQLVQHFPEDAFAARARTKLGLSLDAAVPAAPAAE